jgi:hypothetical protein
MSQTNPGRMSIRHEVMMEGFVQIDNEVGLSVKQI